jgi:hypothetical protein
MKGALSMILFALAIFTAFASCNTHAAVQDANMKDDGDRNSYSPMNKMKIAIGSKTFTAKLYENPTVAALKAMLPLTLEMTELNGNEKYFHLATELPVDAANPGTIQAGDLMLWESNTLVLFYNTFRTSYSYTKLGRIDDASELATAVGSGSVKVRFELERNGG